MSDWNTTDGWNSGASGALSGAQAGFSVGGPIGAVVGGFAGGLSGLFGHKKKTDWNKKAYELQKQQFQEGIRQFNVMDEYNKNRMQYSVKDAIKAGVNPIAALGGSGGHYSPTVSAGGFSPSGSESGGFDTAGFAQNIKATYEQIRQARQDRAISLESASLDLESKRLQNDILRQKLLTESQPGIVSSRGDAPKNSSWRIPMDYRLRDAGDLYLPWKDRQGNIHWYVNPDAIADADWSNIEADRAVAGYRDNWRETSKFPLTRLYRWVRKHDIENPLYYERW